MSFKRRFWLAAAIALLMLLPAAAQKRPSWSELNPSFAIDPALEGRARGYIFMFGARDSGEVSASFAHEPKLGRWSLALDSPIYKKTSISDERGQLVACSMTIQSKLLSDSLGMDRQDISIEGGQILIRFLRGGRQTAESRISLSRPILDLDLLPILLPSVVRGPAAKNFNSDILLKSKGWRINGDFTYYAPGAREVAQELPKLPEPFRQRLSAYPRFHCFRVHPTGLIGLIGGDFFLLFADDEHARFIGYWGGGGKDMEGMILDRQ